LFTALKISALLADSSSRFLEFINKLYPAFANSNAIASPIPLLEPVTTTHFLFKPYIQKSATNIIMVQRYFLIRIGKPNA
jgi:hypothetical protein